MNISKLNKDLQEALEKQRDILVAEIIDGYKDAVRNYGEKEEEYILYALSALEQGLPADIDLLSDLEDYNYDIHVMLPTEDEYTTLLKCHILLPDYHYELTIMETDSWGGYCQCKPEDPGYNPKHKCCGEECDWCYPFVNIFKVQAVGFNSFNGKQKDLWAITEKMKEKYLK